MRKLLVSLACMAASVPAVALAAEEDINVTGVTPAGESKKIDAKNKGKANRLALAQLRERAEKRRERKRAKQAQPRQSSPAPQPAQGGGGGASPNLEAIAACESGGDPSAVGGGGAYRGKYQFDRGTWASVGGSGDPAAASEAEQDRRAAMLYARSGSSPWPNCGQ